MVTLTFNLDAGTTTTELTDGTLTGKYGAALTFAAPTKTGYAFAGWNTVGGTLPETFEEDATYTALWSQVTIAVSEFSDITVTVEQSGTAYTFTADGGYTAYQWQVDGVTQSATGNILSLDVAQWASGTYEITLEAHSGTKYRSWVSIMQVGGN